MEGALESVRALRLEALEPEWVERVHRAEFVESCAAPGARWERAGVRLRPALAACVRALRPAPGLAWGALAPQLDARALQALLFHAMEEGARGEEAHAAGLLASRLYCRLLALPAPRAYPLYHPQLLLASTACLARVSPGALPGLARFLPDLRAVLADLRPAPDDVVYEALLARLTDAMGAAITNQSDPSKHNYDQLELNKISTISYEIIHILLSGKHDEPRPSAIQLLFKCLLPKLVDASMDSRVTNNVVRAAYVTYSGLLLARYGKSALLGFSILLQHLCYTLDGLERAEVRQSRVSLVTGLMTLLPKKSFKQFVKWLLQLTTTAKAPHRHLALEIASKLLDNTLEEEHEQPAAILEQPSSEQPPISLEEPKSSSEQPDTSDQANTSLDPDQSTPEQPDTSELSLTSSDPPPEAPVHTHSEDSQSSQDTMAIEDDKDNMPQIIALAHTIPHYEVVKAVYERVNDVSSTVRMRALTVLMECVASDQPAIVKAVKKVNGDSEQPLLISLAVKCMGDERAVVRKSAVLLVDMLLRRDPTLLTKNNLGVMVSLCRDTSVMVRTAAITALAELMMKWPRDCTFDAFLAGPMHQLSDPEVKVQELIVELVQKVLFDKLECYTPGRTHSEEAPWMFLSAITRHNMRRHLQKTCGILLKAAKCINHRLVDIISTHVATNVDNDLNCMVLLSCVARHVEYHNIDFVLNYYYQLSLDLQGHDARLLPLVLETLTDWSQYLLGEKRSVLRTHLIDGLREGSWGSEGSRRACAALAAHLDPNNIGWASDLLFACEQRALSGAPVSEWVCAADMTLVAPEQPSPRLVQLFISTAAHFHEPTHELSESARGCVVAGLGRMCVRSRAVAAAAAPALCQLLVAPHAAICVRVNALLALSDICTRYTCIVEPLLGDICSCLENSPQQLRRASARTITRLLLGGFLRLRAPLYYRYCALLADEDAEVREPAEFYMTGCLPADVIYHHFVECVMYYNGCSAHSVVASHDSIPDHNVSQDTVSDRRLSGNDPSDRRDEIPENRITHTPERSEKQHDDSVAQENNVEGRMCHESTPVRSLGDDDVAHGLGCMGMSISQDSMLDDTTPEVSPDSAAEKLNTEKDLPTEYMHFDCRQLIYDIMLQRMSLVQRFNIQCRLATEVFAHAADLCDENELTARFESALMDTVTVLRGPHMRLPRKPQTAEAADIDDLTARVTSNIVSQKMKRTVAEVLVPAVIRLYARLRTRGGQLVAYVVRLATDLLKDYRQEIEELIDNDDELIEHITQFQENIGEEPSFSNRLNIVLQEVPDVEATPYMKGGRKRRAPPARHGRPPPKRALRM